MKEGVAWLRANKESLSFDLEEVMKVVHASKVEKQEQTFTVAQMAPQAQPEACGCPGSQTREIKHEAAPVSNTSVVQSNELRQWPVQFHLINPAAGYFKGADLLLAADCSAYTMGNFHSDYLKGKSLIIACPKLDTAQESYLQKLVQLIDHSLVNTIHVLIMEVPCCGGLIRLIDQAMEQAKRKVPVKCTVVSVDGSVLSEEWI